MQSYALEKMLIFVVSVLVGVSLLCWAVAPVMGNNQHAHQASSQHAETVVEHTHSHEPEDHLWWVHHGKHHNPADHDHTPIALLWPPEPRHVSFDRLGYQQPMTSPAPAAPSPFERPPRI